MKKTLNTNIDSKIYQNTRYSFNLHNLGECHISSLCFFGAKKDYAKWSKKPYKNGGFS
jgi:hypothetical protein